MRQDDTQPESSPQVQLVASESVSSTKAKKKKANNETMSDSDKNKTDQSIP